MNQSPPYVTPNPAVLDVSKPLSSATESLNRAVGGAAAEHNARVDEVLQQLRQEKSRSAALLRLLDDQGERLARLDKELRDARIEGDAAVGGNPRLSELLQQFHKEKIRSAALFRLLDDQGERVARLEIELRDAKYAAFVAQAKLEDKDAEVVEITRERDALHTALQSAIAQYRASLRRAQESVDSHAEESLRASEAKVQSLLFHIQQLKAGRVKNMDRINVLESQVETRVQVIYFLLTVICLCLGAMFWLLF